MFDATHGIDLQTFVRGMHLDILEYKGGIRTTEQHTQFQRHLEVLQHRGKGPRDILQQCLTLDKRGLE